MVCMAEIVLLPLAVLPEFSCTVGWFSVIQTCSVGFWYISFELRTDVAAGVGIYLAGRILPLVCELRFCIRILSALFLHFVSYYCVYYMSCMYIAPMFPYVNFFYIFSLYSLPSHYCVRNKESNVETCCSIQQLCALQRIYSNKINTP